MYVVKASSTKLMKTLHAMLYCLIKLALLLANPNITLGLYVDFALSLCDKEMGSPQPKRNWHN